MWKQGELFELKRPDALPQSLARFRLALVREPTGPCEELISCTRAALASRFLHRLLDGEHREVLGAIYLDGRNRAIGHTVAYAGTVNRAVGEPRGLFVPALLANATALILFHNHPSGDPTPSHEDREFTRQMAAAGEILGVRVLDHIVLGEPPAFASLKERGGW